MDKDVQSNQTLLAKRLTAEAEHLANCLQCGKANDYIPQCNMAWSEYASFYLGRVSALERLAEGVYDYIDAETKTTLVQGLDMCRVLLKVLPQSKVPVVLKVDKHRAKPSNKPTLLARIPEGAKFADEFGRVFRNCGSYQRLLECPADVPAPYRSEVGFQFHLSKTQRVFRR